MGTSTGRKVLVGLLVAAGLIGCRGAPTDDTRGSASGQMQGNTGVANYNRDFSQSESNKGSVNPEREGVAGENTRAGAGESGSDPGAPTTAQRDRMAGMGEGTGGSGFPSTLSRENDQRLGLDELPLAPREDVPGIQPTQQQLQQQIDQLEAWLDQLRKQQKQMGAQQQR